MAKMSNGKLAQYRKHDRPAFDFSDAAVAAFLARAAGAGYSLDTTGFLANPGFFQAPHRRSASSDIDIAMVGCPLDLGAIASIWRGGCIIRARFLNRITEAYRAEPALANLMLGLLPAVGGAPLTLERMLGWALAPLAWLCGIPWAEAQAAGALLGVKTVLNELVAYVQLTKSEALSERSRLLLTYALCGFANLGSLGIMIGGLATMCPERRGEIVALGMKSIVAGLLATCLTAATAGLIL